MAHVGGGSNSGGFHSSGSSSSGSYSIQRTDVYGKRHSTYYIRPGFYYNHTYIPYSRVHRGVHAQTGNIILLVISIVLFVIACVSVNFKKSDSKLEDYSINRYYEVYTDSNNEYNILIEIIAYDNLKEIDYLPIVGDYVNSSIDEMFGNEKTYFGSSFYYNLSKEEYIVSNLYEILAKSVVKTCGQISSSYYAYNTENSKIINNTTFDLGDSTNLELALEQFYAITGYNLSVDINYYDSVYNPNYMMMVILIVISILLLIISILGFIKVSKALKFINNEDKNGDVSKYFEGEVKYEDHLKAHPIDKPYKFRDSEYSELRKKVKKDSNGLEY